LIVAVKAGALEVVAFELPCREAADVELIRVQAGIIAGTGELDLEFNLVALHRHTTNRAVSADAWPSPRAVWAAVRELPGLDHFAGFLA